MSEEKSVNKKYKVLFIGGYPTIDNPIRNIFNKRSLDLLSEHCDITVINIRNWIPFRKFISERKENDIRVIEYCFPNFPYHTKYIISINCYLISLFLCKYFRKELNETDVIHSAGASFFGVIGGLVSKKTQIPHIAQLIGSDINSDFQRLKNSWLYNSFNNRVSAVGTNSENLKSEYIKLFPETKLIETIYRGINLREREPKSNYNCSPFTFLFLGGMSKYEELKYKINTKGSVTLMKAWEENEDFFNIKECKLIFGGPSSDCEEFHKWKRNLKFPERVELIGQVSNSDTLIYFRNTNVTLIPSMEEGMPNVALESMSVGTPVIGSDAGGIPEIIEDGVSGFIFDKFKFEELADKMKIIVENKVRLKQFGDNSINTIKTKFDSMNFAKKYIELYNKVSGENN